MSDIKKSRYFPVYDVESPELCVGWMNYEEYLVSPTWAARKALYLDFFNYKCFICRDAPRSLDMHHLHYRTLGNERTFDIIPVCRRCHDALHAGTIEHEQAFHEGGKVYINKHFLGHFWELMEPGVYEQRLQEYRQRRG